MMSYRDMTFCSAACQTADCPRQFTPVDQERADRWWGGPGAPIAFGNFSASCPRFSPTPQPKETRA